MKDHLQSAVVKRGVTVDGVRTSMSLEEQLWVAFKDIANERGQDVHSLASELNKNRTNSNLSSVIRLFVLDYFNNQHMS